MPATRTSARSPGASGGVAGRAIPGPHATLAQVADHIDHIRDVAGIDHVGIGSDFDGGEPLPDGLQDVVVLPGASSPSCSGAATPTTTRARSPAATCCGSCAAPRRWPRRLQTERPPSEATIEELDGAPKA